MKKYLGYIGILLLGLLLGGLLFGTGEEHKKTDTEHNHSQDTETVKNQIWTCSMHPQIRKKEPGKCPICAMALIPAENGTDNALVLEMTEEAVKLSAIQTAIVGMNTAEKGSLNLAGKIKPNEEKAASLVTHVPGRIEKLFVSFTGEQVYKGQKIALIYSSVLITAQRELLEAYKLKSSNPQLLDAAKKKLQYWRITDKQIENILSTQKIQESFIIYAAYSGVISTKRVSVGDHLAEGGVLFDVQNLNTLWVVFDAYETELASLNIGDLVTFTTTSLPNEEFTSKISFIDPIINPSTRTAAIRAEIKNTGNKLKPEMFVEGRVALSTENKSENNLIVPKTAVLWTGERSVVYVKVPDQKIPSFEFREISIGDAIGQNYKVISGLKKGEEIVVNGAFVIDAAAQLNNQASMMNRISEIKN